MSGSSRSSLAHATRVAVRRTAAPNLGTVDYEASDASGVLSRLTIRADLDCPDVERMIHLFYRDYAPRPRLALLT